MPGVFLVLMVLFRISNSRILIKVSICIRGYAFKINNGVKIFFMQIVS